MDVGLRSNGRDQAGARGGGATRRSSAPWRRSTGVGGLGATVGLLACGLAVQHERGMCKPLVSLSRHGEAWSGGFDGDGGSARRDIAGACANVQLWAQQRVQKDVRACSVHRQGETVLGRGCAALQRCDHDGAVAAERRRACPSHKGELQPIGSSATERGR